MAYLMLTDDRQLLSIQGNNMNLAIIQNLGPMELFIIFFVVLIFFGAKRLPSLAASFGKSIKEFKKATQDIENDIQTAMNAEPPKQVHPPQQTVPNTSVEHGTSAAAQPSSTTPDQSTKA
jgi:sec-independent protein translocase protein TatA